ncbi:hypothetical protein GOHSU_14_01490 [Gordonia hirsuta DSM 44140 = NBRC 16056]|uniref:Lipoprotein LpqN n=1 Tax=Gordonia hirsuta DSM 44140 = NBRC 16056 TaxID=1121927 RepID=L7LAA9_9ACTN|nr:hypothetical protein [Gordonia hirsuta]GAC56982.1 hypothetical protein GOHSU_14_01490 [Gordonia hirsuta DSM 44140 = NBRC 16056]
MPSQGSFDAIIENEMQQLRSMTPTVPTGQKGALCGSDSYTVTYPGPPQENVPAREVTSRLVVVPTAGDSSTTVVMTVQAINAQDQTYRADTAKMLDGVQISPAQ